MVRGYLAILLLCGIAAAAPAAAHPPYALVADRTGNVYFSDLETVWRLSSDGRLSVFRAHVRETHVHSLALAPDGAIEGDQNRYDPAAERFYSGLWRRTPAGVEEAIVPLTERPPAGAGVWKDEAGNRYVSQWISSADRRILLLRRRADGRVEVLFDESGGGQRPVQPSVESVGGMAFGADGALFFVNGGVLRRLARDGSVTKIYDGGAQSSLRGLTVAPDGRVLVADMGAKAVLAVATDGSVSTLYREKQAWLPTAVALSGDRVLVLEANADHHEYEDRVRVIELTENGGKVIASPAQPQTAQAAPASPPIQESGPNAGAMLLAGLAAAGIILAAWRFGWRRYPKA